MDDSLGNHAGSHHGTPDLFERDIKLLTDYQLWVKTVKQPRTKFGASETLSTQYNSDWTPSSIDMLKSRLFWRIRSGKAPLPEAPPTAYSCPWYEVVEESDRAHSCWEQVRVYRPGETFAHIKIAVASIAQCFYEVLKEHEDGSLDLKFNSYIFKAWAGKIPGYTVVSPQKCIETELDGWWIQLQK